MITNNLYYKDKDGLIFNGNCLNILENIRENMVDLTVTSPPYDNLKKYNGFDFDFKLIANQLFRVTKPGGIVVWIVNDATIDGDETGSSFEQALYFKDIGFKLHDTMIWHKTNPMPSQSIRYENSFEYMFVFTIGGCGYTNILREQCKTIGTKRNKHHSTQHEKNKPDDGFYRTKKDKVKHNVWDIPVGITKNINHPAPFPEKIANDHILSWSKEGDTILDPMCGSGTTLKMAKINKRKFIGIDISKEYCEESKERLKELYIIEENKNKLKMFF